MSTKAARGTKRLCGGCGAKFYDLNNAPIYCPLCEVEFKLAKPADDKEEKAKKAAAAAAAEKAEAEKKAKAEKKASEIDPDLAAVDDEDLADIEDDDDDDDSSDNSSDTFLEEDVDDGGNDVSEIVGDNKPKVGDDS